MGISGLEKVSELEGILGMDDNIPVNSDISSPVNPNRRGIIARFACSVWTAILDNPIFPDMLFRLIRVFRVVCVARFTIQKFIL